MPRMARAEYRGFEIYVFEAWAGMNAYFVTYAQPDPPCFWDVRNTYAGALEAATEFVREATHEQSPRSNS